MRAVLEEYEFWPWKIVFKVLRTVRNRSQLVACNRVATTGRKTSERQKSKIPARRAICGANTPKTCSTIDLQVGNPAAGAIFRMEQKGKENAEKKQSWK
jgi:hypothetical protein